MICHCCNEQMKCVDDVNEISTRIDWMRCPKCNSFAEIEYDTSSHKIIQVVWKRDYNWERG